MALAHFQETIGRVLADGDVFIGSGASVEVRDETNGALAAIFVDRDGVTPKSNPFNADSQGFADFYVASGRYRVKVSINGDVTLDLRDVEILSNDISSRVVTTSTGTDQPLDEALDQRGPVFDTVADMEAAPDITVGIKCRTLGYSAIGDGGGNDYEIVAAGTGTDDGGSFINLKCRPRAFSPAGMATLSNLAHLAMGFRTTRQRCNLGLIMKEDFASSRLERT